eukprot:1160593-Alexandrium_andersonii.AAC.1
MHPRTLARSRHTPGHGPKTARTHARVNCKRTHRPSPTASGPGTLAPVSAIPVAGMLPMSPLAMLAP